MASEEEKADEAAARTLDATKYGLGSGIHVAARDGNLPALRHFLRVAPERVHAKDSSDGETPLHHAGRYGHVAAAEMLLSKGAAVDAKENDGWTPLHRAADNGHVDAAELLLSKGAVVDAKENKGETPLHRAARYGHVAAAELLLAKGAAVDAKTNSGSMPLQYATENGHVDAAELLLSKGAVVDAKENDGMTPLHKAARNGHVAAAELLLSKGAAVDATDKYGRTPLDIARNYHITEMEQLLLNWPDAAPHAAGSGAVAVKHQRETLKEEAAKALKKAMESGNVEVLKEAIAAAKAEKVSQEDMLEAMEKYMALKESATTSKAEKLVTTSKAESSVKLEPGHKARLAMFSARFNEKNKDTEMKFRAVHKLLMENHYEILMVEAGAGKSYGDDTLKYLRRLGEEKGVMLAVCTSDYGEMTDSPFCTYYELKLAKEYNVDVLPLQVEDNWKPCPPCGEGHRDHSKSALDYIHAVFLPSIVRIDCRKKRVEEIASEIAASLRKP